MKFIGLAAVAAVAGCVAPPPRVLSNDPRVFVMPQSGVLVAIPALVTIDPHGITDVSIEIRNPSQRMVAVNCVVDWFDQRGQPTGGLSAEPSRIAIGADAAEFCRTVSPNPGARSFRASINPAS